MNGAGLDRKGVARAGYWEHQRLGALRPSCAKERIGPHCRCDACIREKTLLVPAWRRDLHQPTKCQDLGCLVCEPPDNVLALVRQELDSEPPLVNQPEDLPDPRPDSGRGSSPYPLARVSRSEATCWQLLWYLCRLWRWRFAEWRDR